MSPMNLRSAKKTLEDMNDMSLDEPTPQRRRSNIKRWRQLKRQLA